MSIPSHLLEQAHSADLVAVAGGYGARLRRGGANEFIGSCPACRDGDDRFSIDLRKRTWTCRKCPGGKAGKSAGGDAIDLIRQIENCSVSEAVQRLTGASWTSPERRRPIPIAVHAQAVDDHAEREKARYFWRQRQPLAGSIAETYLRQARGYGGLIPATLGFLPTRAGHPPALIAAFGMATEPEPGVLAIADAAVMAVQLVKLKPDGSGKAAVDPDKIIIGRPTEATAMRKERIGSPIVLAPPNDLLGLVIAEGLEDALSIHEATGLGAWASGGAGRMPTLADVVPDFIDFVTIVPDRDPAGIKGANALADGLRQRGIKHEVSFLDGGGQ